MKVIICCLVIMIVLSFGIGYFVGKDVVGEVSCPVVTCQEKFLSAEFCLPRCRELRSLVVDDLVDANRIQITRWKE